MILLVQLCTFARTQRGNERLSRGNMPFTFDVSTRLEGIYCFIQSGRNLMKYVSIVTTPQCTR